ncbi:MAG TPA: hypothetical protein VNM48_03520 [Chloroflexota bacterium]|nr:hypothetical protein [Chloroflexota bacterium]
MRREPLDDEAEEWAGAARAALPAVEDLLRRREVPPRVRERLEMVKGVALGQPLEEESTGGVVAPAARFSAGSARLPAVGAPPLLTRHATAGP